MLELQLVASVAVFQRVRAASGSFCYCLPEQQLVVSVAGGFVFFFLTVQTPSSLGVCGYTAIAVPVVVVVVVVRDGDKPLFLLDGISLFVSQMS